MIDWFFVLGASCFFVLGWAFGNWQGARLVKDTLELAGRLEAENVRLTAEALLRTEKKRR